MGKAMKDLFGRETHDEIKGKYVNILVNTETSALTKEILKLYTAWSNIESTHILAGMQEYDIDLKPLVETIEIGAKQKFKWNYIAPEKQQLNITKTNNVVVCFSGGKDSTAAALKMKELGKNVFLFYVKGINKSYPEEQQRAIEIAAYLNMPLKVIEIKQFGKTTFYDNPIKNQLIASLAFDYCVMEGIGTDVAFGDFTTDNIFNSCFNEDWSDCTEMWNAYIEYIRKYNSKFKVIIPFNTYLETMDVVGGDKTLLNLVQGCVLPNRFRKMIKSENEKKYNIQLLKNRCGSCWKCCVEYIHYANSGIIEYNEKFYEHCIDILAKKTKELKPNIKDYTFDNIYSAFFYDDFTETRYYKEVYGK